MYEIIEHTADVGIKGYGKTPAEILQEMSRGMFSLIVDLNTVRQEIEEKIEVRGENYEELAFAYLSELLFLHDTARLVFSGFDVNIEKEDGIFVLRARVRGEKIKAHELKLLVKGITYHMLEINESQGYGTVILDV
ncbi:MAG: archease [Thermoplasmata archaeon]|nr:archease [Thermoplasmata archaeon]